MMSDSYSRAIGAIDQFHRTRGKRPGYLLMGTEAWLRLGLQLRTMTRDGQGPTRVSEFVGIPIVVDDEGPDRDVIRALPTTGEDVRP